jgi:Protein of unknown function (DUF2786)
LRAAARRLTISAEFTETERQRFHNLLQLAAESPFEGERSNALAAAERLATRFGLTLEEAAAGGAKESRQEAPRGDDHLADDLGFQPRTLDRFARAAHLMDGFIYNDKARREAALREAQSRGLDADELRKAVTSSVTKVRSNRRRMNPYRHASALLRETSLSFTEIANITGLDIYDVVGLKLKLRAAT